MRLGTWVKRILGLLVLFVLAACGDDLGGPATENGEQARLTLRLTDAPGDIQAAVVTIAEIKLQGGPNGPILVSDQPITLDLTELADSASVLVNQAAIPAGSYAELRFVITGGFIAVEDAAGGQQIFASSPIFAGLPPGTVPDGILVMPSLGQSGLKVTFDDPLVLTGDNDLLVDFDVSQSFGREAGNSGRWVMQPVVRGGTTAEAGSIRATVALGAGITLPTLNGTPVTLADFQVRVGGELKPVTDDGTGVFGATFGLLLPGTYPVTLVAPAGISVTSNVAQPVNTDVAPGANVTVAFTITAAVLGSGG